jgi:hypothetical protein
VQLPPPNPLRFEPCPATGEGVHIWLLAQANRCRNGGLTKEVTEILLRESSQGCGRRVPEAEIRAAIRKAFSTDSTAGENPRPCASKSPPRQKPDRFIDFDQIAAIASGGEGLADLWEDSEVRLDDDEPLTETIIDTLFPGDPFLCVAEKDPRIPHTQPRSAWRGQLSSCAYIVPSPMSNTTGMTQDSRVSERSLDNTGPRRYLIVEFDSGSFDQQAAILLHLGRYAPLVLVVHSRGKSLHGWFTVADIPEPKVDRFWRYAKTLGADPIHWTRCQFTRMPDGLRQTGERQTVFFFAPALAHA